MDENLGNKSDQRRGACKSLSQSDRGVQSYITALEHERDKYRLEMSRLRDDIEIRKKFVTTLVHDLRNTILAANMGIEHLGLEVSSSSDAQELLAIITRNLKKSEHMLQDFLDVSYMNSDTGLPLHLDNCSLRKIIQEALDVLTPVHGKRFKIQGPEDVAGFWSEQALRRALVNLASNAVKYGSADTQITISFLSDTEHTFISVQNFGPPIAKDDQKFLFDLFFRSQSVQTKYQGWGIGLPLVKSIAHAHGGKITVQSRQDEGTTFTLTLPNDARFPLERVKT